ncbi:MAG: tetratricopeptide repeat protein [Proteobacteria bacterium]|jgi:Flp pilus assembly protein TadD|nr:tetratricopeptide repeat protein [Pseudomonadota bacterium]
MGLLSWLFPSEADRVVRAQQYLKEENWADARMEVLDIQSDEAQGIVVQAEHQLCRLNLEAALSWCHAEDDHRVSHHMEMANNFHRGGLEDLFREVRREMRELRAEREERDRRKKEEQDARLLDVNPLGLSSDGLPDPPIPEGLSEEEADELKARLALIVDGYPEALRGRVGALGADFAGAVLKLDEGQPELALQTFLALPDDDPLVCYERARAAHALGDSKAAARALLAFAQHAPGHHMVGNRHTGVFLAQLTAETGDLKEALRVLNNVRKKDPTQGGPLFAQLLEANGHYDQAESVLLGLLKEHNKETMLYTLLARVQVRKGERMQAMRVLEGALQATDCKPGRCGYRPPDPNVLRSLAILYLEDGIEEDRAFELAQQAQPLVKNPGWEDLYLAALMGRAQRDPAAENMVAKLWQATPDNTSEHERLAQHLPQA